MRNELFKQTLNCPLIFVEGKGGVGKTLISQAMAHLLASKNKKTLWVTFEDPSLEKNFKKEIFPNLWIHNCDAGSSFEEYAALKLKFQSLARIFVGNKVIRYLAHAAPGIHEIVLLGKIWHERLHYDHIVIDMPSTGYGIAMFKSTFNFSRLFKGGPLQKDAEMMLDTFSNPKESSHVVVALPEEMPLQEALELHEYLLQFFPKNPSFFLVNKKFPELAESPTHHFSAQSSHSPLAQSATDYLYSRSHLEKNNLEIWNKNHLSYVEIPYFSEPSSEIIPFFLPLATTAKKYMENNLCL